MTETKQGDDKIIPINRAMIRMLESILEASKCCMPERDFNTLLIDRKGFIKSLTTRGSYIEPYIRIPIYPRMPTVMNWDSSATTAPQTEVAEFVFYREVGGVFEYREI